MQPLTEKAMSDTRRPMGRPALGIISTTVRLSKATLERIDAIAGKKRRAAFIREAVEEKLKRET